MTTARDPIYAGYRYPAEIISYAVWLYFLFPLSLRMVEEMLAARGISIAGKKHWLWRAVDQDGFVLDVLAQSRRDKRAAKRLLRKLLKKQMRPPRVMITDKLASYGAAKREIMPGI